MIVLDEHLQSKGLEESLRKRYAGSVVSILDLRPHTIIKDEAIPVLLAQQSHPVFVTINVNDFWQRLPMSDKFCLVCFAVTTSEIPQIPDLLRRLLRHADFSAKAKRAGKAVRITVQGNATFYTVGDEAIRVLEGF